jgi:hypothetical protein
MHNYLSRYPHDGLAALDQPCSIHRTCVVGPQCHHLCRAGVRPQMLRQDRSQDLILAPQLLSVQQHIGDLVVRVRARGRVDHDACVWERGYKGQKGYLSSRGGCQQR